MVAAWAGQLNRPCSVTLISRDGTVMQPPAIGMITTAKALGPLVPVVAYTSCRMIRRFYNNFYLQRDRFNDPGGSRC